VVKAGEMRRVFISEQSNDMVKAYLYEKGYMVCEIRRTSAVYPSVASHPDIYLCNLGNELVMAKEQLPFIEEQLGPDFNYYPGATPLGYKYPHNVKYNAVRLGHFFIHNFKLTDPFLLSLAEEKGLRLIPVKQGYTKCNLVVVDEQSVITSDLGLKKALEPYGIKVLTVSQGHVKLTGFDYGFLGGASGRVGREIIFHGNLAMHPDYGVIKEFIEGRSLTIKYFKEFPLEDIGSIIEY
jgi:hypothetical protein